MDILNFAKITAEKAEELMGKTYDGTQVYNPIELTDGSFIVSFQEAQYLAQSDFEVWKYVEDMIKKPDIEEIQEN